MDRSGCRRTFLEKRVRKGAGIVRNGKMRKKGAGTIKNGEITNTCKMGTTNKAMRNVEDGGEEGT